MRCETCGLETGSEFCRCDEYLALGFHEGDIAEGAYWFAADYHSGQWSELYEALSGNPFSPSCLANGPEGYASQFVYDELTTIAVGF